MDVAPAPGHPHHQPPLLLTTLKGMDAFKDSRVVSAVDPPADVAAPISSVRVRVADVTGIDPASQARIGRVALGISRSTGLDVDVTIGSSPQTQTVLLPAGRYGRPGLEVEEYWLLGLVLAFKGTVAGSLLGEAVIIEVTTADFVAVTVTALLGAAVIAETLALEVRERAPELATLSATGWRDSRLAMLLGYEGVGIGLAGSLIGAGVGFGAASILETPVESLVTAALVAVAAGMTVAAAASVGPMLALRQLSVPQLLAEE